ncbi:hypothetical protein VTN00DRAFT_8436 [Thermoascus crustaceus]|uniref:uncharacterized protein n=1 Tax=Thermoascus crustaceus TaxID=5088 RepID=UPI003742234F
MRAVVGGSAQATGPPELSVRPVPAQPRKHHAWTCGVKLVDSLELRGILEGEGRQEQQRRFRARPTLVKCASPLTTDSILPGKILETPALLRRTSQKRLILAVDEIARATKASEPVRTFCIVHEFLSRPSASPAHGSLKNSPSTRLAGREPEVHHQKLIASQG